MDVSPPDTDEASLRAVVDAIPAVVAYVDAEQRYRVVNATFRRWFDAIYGDVRGRHVRDVVGPAAYELIRPLIERALAGTPVELESRVLGLDGAVRWLHADYVPDLDAEGRVRGFVALAYDITPRKREAEQLAGGPRAPG